MPRPKTRKTRYAELSELITGITTEKKVIRTKPTYKANVAEKIVLKECLHWLRTRRILAERNNTGFGDLSGIGHMYRYGIKDAGDIIGCVYGKYFEVECKHGHGGTWSPGQQERKRKVEAAGGLYFLAHSVDELAAHFEPMLPGLF